MFELNDFVFFEHNYTEIGINLQETEKILSSLKNSKIKKDYLLASVPKHLIYYNSFFIKKKLITVNDFRIFRKDSSYITDAENEGWGWVWDGKWVKRAKVSWERPFLNIMDQYYNDNADIFPVMQVSWNDAVAYTKWLSEKTNKIYRLPYEFEWEIFAQYGEYQSVINIFESNDIKYGDNESFLHQLAERIINSKFQFGILWEWIQDWYSGYDKLIKNKDFGKIYKILRGGSLLSDNYQRTKEFRFRRCPTARSPYYGFRVVFIPNKIEEEWF